MIGDRKLMHVVRERVRPPLRLAFIHPITDAFRTWFTLPASGADLAMAFGFGARVARHVQAQREERRTADLDMLIEGCAIADAPQAVPPPPAAQNESAGIVDTVVAPSSSDELLQDNLSVLPVIKSGAELESIFGGVQGVLAETLTRVQEAQTKARAHIEGQNQQLLASGRQIMRLQGNVRELTSKNQDLTSRLQERDKELSAAHDRCATVSKELETASGTLSNLKSQLSSTATKGFMRGAVFAVLAVLLIWLVGHFAMSAIAH